MKDGKRILKVTVRRIPDESPDTSHLGEYSERRSSEYSIDRQESGDMKRGEYRYFNPSFNYVDEDGEPLPGNMPEEVQRYVAEDYARMESLNRWAWGYVGLRAEAEVQLTEHGPIQRLTSGGLWGIESDSEESYFAEVEGDELADLKATLTAAGFGKRAIAAAFKGRERAY